VESERAYAAPLDIGDVFPLVRGNCCCGERRSRRRMDRHDDLSPGSMVEAESIPGTVFESTLK
jgi:hypothetical protein